MFHVRFGCETAALSMASPALASWQACLCVVQWRLWQATEQYATRRQRAHFLSDDDVRSPHCAQPRRSSSSSAVVVAAATRGGGGSGAPPPRAVAAASSAAAAAAAAPSRNAPSPECRGGGAFRVSAEVVACFA